MRGICSGEAKQQQAFLLLASVPGIGYQTLRKIASQTKKTVFDWNSFLQSREVIWKTYGLKQKQRDQLKACLHQHTPQTYFERLCAQHISVVFPTDSVYPPLLAEIPSPPHCLFVLGHPDPQQFLHPQVGIVGTRSMTEYGRFAAHKIAQEVCNCQATVISGFMYGVDLQAHQAAIQCGGQTSAILGYGFDSLSRQTYFPRNWPREFLDKGGTLWSEYPPEVTPTKGTFLQRNRLIAGMSHAVVVIEAAQKSGSLHTASCATEYNRLVCAIPGSIRSTFSDGTLALINQGATLVNSGYQVIQELSDSLGLKSVLKNQLSGNPTASSQNGLASQLGQAVCQLLTQDELTADQIASHLQINLPELHEELTELEVFGLIQRDGPRWSLK